MPICIECRYPVTALYTTYSKADDSSQGKGVRLTQCPHCKHFADKYVEHDFVVLFIDLVLIKPQVYRHLLFNRLGTDDGRFDPSITRLAVLLLLFDVYLTWARIEKASLIDASPLLPTSADLATTATLPPPPSLLSSQTIILQYLFFLTLCTLETIAFHLPLRLLTSLPPPDDRALVSVSALVPRYPHPNRVSTALLVSSCTKLLPILMVVWEYDLPSSASAVSWAVIVNNVAALQILLDCGYVSATLLAGVGALARAATGWALLRAVGLGGKSAAMGVIETGDLIGFYEEVVRFFGG